MGQFAVFELEVVLQTVWTFAFVAIFARADLVFVGPRGSTEVSLTLAGGPVRALSWLRLQLPADPLRAYIPVVLTDPADPLGPISRLPLQVRRTRSGPISRQLSLRD